LLTFSAEVFHKLVHNRIASRNGPLNDFLRKRRNSCDNSAGLEILMSGIDHFIIALSGPVSVGKSTLCAAIVEHYGFAWLKTREVVRLMTGAAMERQALQEAGAHLEEQTRGRWLSEHLVNNPDFRGMPRIIVDSVRLPQQIESLREVGGSEVFHIHLTAASMVLHERYATRQGDVEERASHSEAQSHRIESSGKALDEIADLIIDTSQKTPAQVFSESARQIEIHLKVRWT
jgi:dephospho-CoA kinase